MSDLFLAVLAGKKPDYPRIELPKHEINEAIEYLKSILNPSDPLNSCRFAEFMFCFDVVDRERKRLGLSIAMPRPDTSESVEVMFQKLDTIQAEIWIDGCEDSDEDCTDDEPLCASEGEGDDFDGEITVPADEELVKLVSSAVADGTGQTGPDANVADNPNDRSKPQPNSVTKSSGIVIEKRTEEGEAKTIPKTGLNTNGA